jgi:hypothetical protein
MRQLFFVLSFSVFSLTAFAQKFEAGITLGTSAYNGDLDVNARNVWSSLRIGGGLVGKYRLTNSLVLRGHLILASLTADEKNHPTAWRQERGFAFKTQTTELAFVLEKDFWHIGKATAFAFGGLGGTYFKPATDYNEPNPRFIKDDINPDANASYSRVTPTLPLGLGLRFPLPFDLNLSLEAGYRKVFTDYLDGISQLGNPDKKDAYFFGGATLTKSFGKRTGASGSENCPRF